MTRIPAKLVGLVGIALFSSRDIGEYGDTSFCDPWYDFNVTTTETELVHVVHTGILPQTPLDGSCNADS